MCTVQCPLQVSHQYATSGEYTACDWRAVTLLRLKITPGQLLFAVIMFFVKQKTAGSSCEAPSALCEAGRLINHTSDDGQKRQNTVRLERPSIVLGATL